jgi:SAM-dependent methyltransferase
MSESPGLRHVTSDDFRAEAASFAERWDLEWLRYFRIHENHDYFVPYSSPKYPFSIPKNEVAKFDAHQTLTTRLNPELMHTKLQVFVPGSELVDKKVFELGCGVGMLGRILGHIAAGYVGCDYSPFAIYAASLLSPATCEYVPLKDPDRLVELAGTFDTTVPRHFFIHNNFGNALWVLQLMRDLVHDQGVIHADFLWSEELNDGVRPAKSELHPMQASAGFVYTPDDIQELADRVGLTVRTMDRVDVPPRTFVSFTVA